MIIKEQCLGIEVQMFATGFITYRVDSLKHYIGFTAIYIIKV